MVDPFKNIAENMLRDGIIDPLNKSDEEILAKMKKALAQHLGNKSDLEYTVDHRKGILNQARMYYKNKNIFYANIFYSLFVEHWINNIIFVAVRRKKMKRDYLNEIIRNNNLKSKLTWILEFLGFDPIPKNHIDVISKLFENRNSFVHYKWKSFEFNKKDYFDNNIKMLMHIELVEKTIKYLQNYENKKIFNNKRNVAKKF